MRGLQPKDALRRAQHIRATEERLRRTEELLETKTAELIGAQASLSTTDHLSEAEVLRIVDDLNENIFQAAAKLTEEWVTLESPQGIKSMDVGPISQPHAPALVRNRNPVRLMLMLQSCLCSRAVSMTSSWGHHQELAVLDSVHRRLSASGGYRVFCTGGVGLTYHRGTGNTS